MKLSTIFLSLVLLHLAFGYMDQTNLLTYGVVKGHDSGYPHNVAAANSFTFTATEYRGEAKFAEGKYATFNSDSGLTQTILTAFKNDVYQYNAKVNIRVEHMVAGRKGDLFLIAELLGNKAVNIDPRGRDQKVTPGDYSRTIFLVYNKALKLQHYLILSGPRFSIDAFALVKGSDSEVFLGGNMLGGGLTIGDLTMEIGAQNMAIFLVHLKIDTSLTNNMDLAQQGTQADDIVYKHGYALARRVIVEQRSKNTWNGPWGAYKTFDSNDDAKGRFDPQDPDFMYADDAIAYGPFTITSIAADQGGVFFTIKQGVSLNTPLLEVHTKVKFDLGDFANGPKSIVFEQDASYLVAMNKDTFDLGWFHSDASKFTLSNPLNVMDVSKSEVFTQFANGFEVGADAIIFKYRRDNGNRDTAFMFYHGGDDVQVGEGIQFNPSSVVQDFVIGANNHLYVALGYVTTNTPWLLTVVGGTKKTYFPSETKQTGLLIELSESGKYLTHALFRPWKGSDQVIDVQLASDYKAGPLQALMLYQGVILTPSDNALADGNANPPFTHLALVSFDTVPSAITDLEMPEAFSITPKVGVFEIDYEANDALEGVKVKIVHYDQYYEKLGASLLDYNRAPTTGKYHVEVNVEDLLFEGNPSFYSEILLEGMNAEGSVINVVAEYLNNAPANIADLTNLELHRFNDHTITINTDYMVPTNIITTGYDGPGVYTMLDEQCWNTLKADTLCQTDFVVDVSKEDYIQFAIAGTNYLQSENAIKLDFTGPVQPVEDLRITGGPDGPSMTLNWYPGLIGVLPAGYKVQVQCYTNGAWGSTLDNTTTKMAISFGDVNACIRDANTTMVKAFVTAIDAQDATASRVKILATVNNEIA